MSTHRIRVLPDVVVNRIAAGEVVERPASCLKELVENAIDARGRNVRIQLEEAGKGLIKVSDDGYGMDREETLLCLERHATSKLLTEEDLEHIDTMGFRGEALPSIASISRFTLTSRTTDGEAGTRVTVEGGTLRGSEEVGAPKGTTVEVRDLFFNTPARRKFLKGDGTELRNCVETATMLALVHNEVGFELKNGKRLLVALPAGQTRAERAGELVGAEAPSGLHWFEKSGDALKVTLGFAAPHDGRGHRKGVRLFVNRRPVTDRLLFRALMEGFRGVLETGRYPLALLWLELPPEQVDVNVHPAKREVRFRNEGKVFGWVAGCVGEAVSQAPWMAGARTTAAQTREERTAYPASSGDRTTDRIAEILATYSNRSERASSGSSGQPHRFTGASQLPLSGSTAARPPSSFPVPPAPRPGGTAIERVEPTRFGHLRYMGSFSSTYLFFDDVDSDELVVVDQHAAHERILYEGFLASLEGRVRAQTQLVPVVLDCSAAEMEGFAEREGEFEALGFGVERFGHASLSVTEAPPKLDSAQIERVVRDVLSEGFSLDDAGGVRAMREGFAARAACAAAVKAGDRLDVSEAFALISSLEDLSNPSHCPHGRPLLIRMTRAQMETFFHRR